MVPDELLQRLRRHGQEHVLAWWDELNEEQADAFHRQLAELDLEHLADLYAQRDRPFPLPRPEDIEPVPVITLEDDEGADAARTLGEVALRRGEVAVLVVAGGQGTRLGFDHAKGMFPVGPISRKSLFQIHTEKVLALSRRYGNKIPLLIMTSHATDAETQAFFREHDYFGVDPQHITFFQQGTMPALDMHSGQLLMEHKHQLFSSPNGHGGTLTALKEHGLLERLRSQRLQHVFYFQVDNPLVRVADPTFLGRHLDARAEVSSKAISKERPTDKLGNLVLVGGRCHIIEYSDLPEELAEKRDLMGKMLFWAGSPAIHIFDVDFLTRITRDRSSMPFHIALKKVPHLDAQGRVVQPAKENALKFETFIFDALPQAERWTVVETSRRREFEPLKNATGPDSPESVRQALCNQAGDWLERAGIVVPRNKNGDVTVPLEISPLFALDADEFAAKVNRSQRVDGPRYFKEP
jgi:UDP-N-acetylglucosamine/UDP-N-acetylgalactosamine diphosphorylase